MDANSVYWTAGTASYDTGAVMKVPLAGGAAVALASGAPEPDSIAVDATAVYWTTGKGGTVMKVPLAGGTITTLASGSSAWAIAVDAASVYWATGSEGSVLKVPLAGGPIVTLASGQADTAAVAVDASSVYWTNRGTYDSSGALTGYSGAVLKLGPQ